MQMLLEVDDGLEPAFPDVAVDELWWQILRLEDFGMDTNDQDLLIVRAVEDADPTAFGKRHRSAPEKIVRELDRAGMLKADHLDALRVDAGHHVLDDAILAGGIQRLKDD